MQFVVKLPAHATHALRKYRYRIVGQRKRREAVPVDWTVNHKGKRRPVYTRAMRVGSFRHEGVLVHAGDVIESDRDLAAAFPDRFKKVEEHQ